MAIVHEIPVVDISPFIDSSASQEARDEVVSNIRDACMTYGFFQLVGHDIPLALQNKVLESARIFFDLPLEEKRALGMDKALGESKRGYELIGGQVLQAGSLPDLKEGFYIGREIPADDPRAGKFLQGPNLWPDVPKEKFQQPIMEYHRQILELTHLLLDVIASSLPYSPDIFEEFKQEPIANLRLLHYPPQASKDARQLGAGAHTDFGAITLLLQQPDQPGLQVLYPPTKSWLPVPAVANTFVVNIGDMLDRWTNSAYRSAVHRVINYGVNHRYSIPFFYDGNVQSRLAPLDGSGMDDKAVLTVEGHMRERFGSTYGPVKI